MNSEEKLIRDCKKGKSAAQDLVYRKYAGKMLGVCMRYTGNKQEAEDVLQDAFIKVFTKIRSFNTNEKGSFAGWIHRIMVTTALNYIRDNKKHNYHSDIDEVEPENYEGYDQHDDAESSIDSKKVMEIIQELPTGYKTVFNLYVFEKYTHQEIADELGISVNTSKSQLSKARTMIKKKINEYKNATIISKAI
jgi:RNA polymerase sigma factor (sigma-70 family)